LRVNTILILGGGSAGFLAATTLKKKLPELSVTVIRSKEIGIIGVGEGTTPGVPRHLLGYLNLDPGEFHRQARPTWKLGIRLLWGHRPFFDYTFGPQIDWKWNALPKPNGFYCDEEFTYVDVASSLMSQNRAFVRQPNGEPLIGRDFGYHMENEKFVTYLEGQAARLGIRIRDETIIEATLGEVGVTGLRLASGEILSADLYVDCSGFRSFLLAQTLGEPYLSFKSTLFCDRAVAGGWDRTDEPVKPYTTAETMDSGWCWQIEHEHRVARGYVYSSDFITDDEAEREFRAKNPKVQSTRLVKFPSGRYRDSWVKNVVAVGNASGFVEPLEATSLWIICFECRIIAEMLADCDRRPGPALVAVYNRVAARAWDSIRQFLAVHYRFNRRLDTPFWRACRADVDLVGAGPLVEYYEENGPSTFARNILLESDDLFGLEGHFTLLVGQKVPYRRVYTPSEEEQRIWQSIRAENHARAVDGLTIPEALAAIHSPSWTWYPGYYK